MSRQDAPVVEEVEEFRQRARAWIRDNVRAMKPDELVAFGRASDEEERAQVAHERELQRKLLLGAHARVAHRCEQL